MKIVIFSDVFTPLVNGITTFVKNYSMSLADNGHDVYIIAPRYKNEKEFSYKNIKVIRVWALPFPVYPGFKLTSPYNYKIHKLIKEINPDIIHFQVAMPLGFQAILFSRIYKIPLIGTFHTFFTDKEYLKHVNLDYRFVEDLAWGYNKLFYNRCDLITCPAISTKEELDKHNFNKKILSISNLINIDIFSKHKSNDTIKKLNLGDKSIIYFGRISREKNIEYLLNTFSLVLKNIPKAKFLIVGEGPQFEELKKKCVELKISDNVIFTGLVKHKDLFSYIKGCGIFVTASTTETFGLTTIEAMTCGLPGIGLDATGTRDIIKDGVNGYLIKNKNDSEKEFASKIIKLLTDDKLRAKFSTMALFESKKYDQKKIIKIWEEEYSKLMIKNR
ncbi:hypothetical protein COU57_04600 [Candidatus Pacearchaeota archaeon CG10_big_fil_rev_8_21_14_0_10_32_14]|nr:MAG: hypothetical protein COU57_04600 [Candidatus Pacearchaeota archaeon CG10_big_fil_rev_8_21_14_0_10_32_14]